MSDDTSVETQVAETPNEDPRDEHSMTAEPTNSKVHEETIMVEIPLDDAHAEMVDAMKESGQDVKKLLSANLAPTAEQTIHQLYQQGKYQQQ